LGQDQIMDAEATRGANKTAKSMITDPITGTAKQGKETDAFMSPTSFLLGGKSPPMSNFMANAEVDCIQFEGEMIRKASETKLKKYWYCLLGKELYVYKNRQEEKHKGMHNLVGVFITDDPEEKLDEQTTIYPFSLIFPGNRPRTYYLLKKDDKKKWMEAIKKVIGHTNLAEHYDFKDTIGKGKFGLVKSAIHKKSGK